MIWLIWIALFVILTFAAAETYCIKTGRKTLSRTVWTITKAWPPFGVVFGLVIGFLICHFFWIGQGCDIMKSASGQSVTDAIMMIDAVREQDLAIVYACGFRYGQNDIGRIVMTDAETIAPPRLCEAIQTVASRNGFAPKGSQ